MIGRNKLKNDSKILVGHLRAIFNDKRENYVEPHVEPRLGQLCQNAGENWYIYVHGH